MCTISTNLHPDCRHKNIFLIIISLETEKSTLFCFIMRTSGSEEVIGLSGFWSLRIIINKVLRPGITDFLLLQAGNCRKRKEFANPCPIKTLTKTMRCSRVSLRNTCECPRFQVHEGQSCGRP